MKFGILGSIDLPQYAIDLIIDRVMLATPYHFHEIVHSGNSRPLGRGVYEYFRRLKDNNLGVVIPKITCIAPEIPTCSVVEPRSLPILLNNTRLAQYCQGFVVIHDGRSTLDRDMIAKGFQFNKPMWEMVIPDASTLSTLSEEEIKEQLLRTTFLVSLGPISDERKLSKSSSNKEPQLRSGG